LFSVTDRILFYSANSDAIKHGGRAMKSSKLKLIDCADMRPAGRKPNRAYRVREHLTEGEMAKLLTALKANRHGHRDWLIGLLIYRHGLRVSEACDLRWDDLNLAKGTITVRRLKGGVDSGHYLERDELAGLKRRQREQEPKAAYVFVNERGQPFGRMGIARMIERAGETAKLPFPAHVHMLRHSTGHSLAGTGMGYAAATALLGPRQHQQHRALHRDVAGAVQEPVALSRLGRPYHTTLKCIL
jgi:integrase